MSRCYPYPPPGYQKKDHVELGLSPKKEKHKHKDKKKKRRKDSETNGELPPRDKEKRSKKSQQTGGTDEGTSLPNGKSEIKPTPTVAVHEHTIQRVQPEKSRENVFPDGLLASKMEPDTKVASQPPTVSVKVTGNGNGAASNEIVPATRPSSQKQNELSMQRHAQFVPHIEKVLSPVDDQEWLFTCDDELQRGSKKQLEEGEIPQVWSESLLLPSVNIYALPYVVPD